MPKLLLRFTILFSLITPLSFAQDSGANEKITIAEFSKKSLEDWEEKEFENETRYSFVELDGETALQAVSDTSASGMFRKIEVDIERFPYLNWHWRIDQSLPAMDETTKDFDDYVARIYVVKSGGFFFWKTKALNYVWSSRESKDAVWPNAFAPNNTRMLAVRSASDASGIWYHEKRNIYEDLKAWLGEEVDQIDAVAIMTDTDNSGLRAKAYYGDIYFSAE